MKNGSSTILSITCLALWIAFCVATTAQAQNREKYIISATAGGINYVSGNVTVERAGSQRHHALTSKDDLKTGDSVTTGAGGRVEVLLNPGSYMRVDENSEFELEDASLDNLRVKLVKGSAILEVTGADGVKLELRIITPQTDVLIIRRGIYRFNVLPNETTEVAVRKGRALYGKGLANQLKDGQKVLLERSRMEVAKLDKKNQDTLDLWSKERAETLAHANRQLQNRALIAAFNDYERDTLGIIQSRYGLGFWVYSGRLGGFCFLPFGWNTWSSPYGYDYRTGYNFGGNGWGPYWSQRNYPTPGTGATGSTGTGGSTGAGGSTSGNTNPNPAPAPAPQPTYQPPSLPMQPIERAPSERVPIREAPTRESASPNK